MKPKNLLPLLLVLAPLASAKSPISHEAMWLMKRPGSPVPSPDGKWVAFSLTEPAYDEKDQSTDLWLVPADGSAKPRRITFTRGAESGIAWSPDSRRIAFTAKREGDEANQLYLLDLEAGGEALRLTSLPSGVSSPSWSPDGRLLSFTSSIDPKAAEKKGRRYNARVYDGFPIRFWDKWLDDSRPHLFVQAAEAGATPRDLLESTRLAASPGFAGTETMSGQEIVAAWAPDSQSLVFAASVNRDQAAYAPVRTDLYQVPVSGGEPKALTSGPDSYSRPAFRPDGKALYCLHSREGAMLYSLSRLAMARWPMREAMSVISNEFDRSVSSFAFTPDSSRIYLLAEDAGHDKLYSLPAQGGPATLAFEMKQGGYSGLAVPPKAAEPILLALYDSAVEPHEIVRIQPESGNHKLLTDFNVARAAEIDWAPVRHFWFTSKAGRRIHNLVILPPNFDPSRKYPLVVFLHGGPHSMSRDQFFTRWNYHLLAQPGYVVIMPNYTGSTGFGEKFAQQIQGDPLRTPGHEINQAAEEAVKAFPFIDPARIAAGGASYGGHLANWLQATTTHYKCLFSHAGLINLESQWGTSDTIYHREVGNLGPVWEQGPVWREQNPIRYAARFRTPILLTAGEKDFRVPLNQTLENWSVLQRLRIPSRLVVFPDANHWIQKGEDSRFFYTELHAWLKRYLE